MLSFIKHICWHKVFKEGDEIVSEYLNKDDVVKSPIVPYSLNELSSKELGDIIIPIDQEVDYSLMDPILAQDLFDRWIFLSISLTSDNQLT